MPQKQPELRQECLACAELYCTFEENEFAIRALIGCVDLGREALPELLNLHGVPLLHAVVAQTPEPAILRKPEAS